MKTVYSGVAIDSKRLEAKVYADILCRSLSSMEFCYRWEMCNLLGTQISGTSAVSFDTTYITSHEISYRLRRGVYEKTSQPGISRIEDLTSDETCRALAGNIQRFVRVETCMDDIWFVVSEEEQPDGAFFRPYLDIIP